jgi:hypothetical protein
MGVDQTKVIVFPICTSPLTLGSGGGGISSNAGCVGLGEGVGFFDGVGVDAGGGVDVERSVRV